MAARRTTDLSEAVSRFTQEIEDIVRRRVDAEFAARFDELRDAILKGTRKAPATTPAPRAPRAAAATTGRKKKVTRAGKPAALIPCPVTGIPNKGRRFSYLAPEARTDENREKFRGWHRKSAEEQRALGVLPAATDAVLKMQETAEKSAKKSRSAKS